MTACLSCLRETGSPDGYHPECLETLFGARALPVIDVDQAHLHTLALAMVGKTSVSGIQRKISMGLSPDRTTLQVAAEGARFLLKPQAGTFPRLPENEHTTMRIAERAGIEIPPCALVRLRDGSLAYLVARFDRPSTGGKLRQEDFCQLAEKSPKEKYAGSAELCARIVRRYASEPGIDVLALYRRMVFSWWTGNGDMHLKNFSLLCGPDGMQRISPAYDLLCTRLVIPDDPLALPMLGKNDGITRKTWLGYARYCAIPDRAAERVLAEIVACMPTAVALVNAGYLDVEMKRAYEALLRQRTRVLGVSSNKKS